MKKAVLFFALLAVTVASWCVVIEAEQPNYLAAAAVIVGLVGTMLLMIYPAFYDFLFNKD